MSVHLPGLKEGIKDILKAEFNETYSRAFRKGWVRTETQLLSQATQEIRSSAHALLPLSMPVHALIEQPVGAKPSTVYYNSD
jgi:hypothetical protein